MEDNSLVFRWQLSCAREQSFWNVCITPFSFVAHSGWYVKGQIDWHSTALLVANVAQKARTGSGEGRIGIDCLVSRSLLCSF